jgi:hypothetical protein
MISSRFQRSAIHVFLISFACVYYFANAPLMLGHYDLGWHLAAGDLIREQGDIPFQDPWSFTLEGRRWYNLSWLWDVIASALFQYANFSGLILFVVACGAAIVGYLASVCLSSGASAIAVCISVFSSCLLYPAFTTPPNIYLAASPNTSTMLFAVVFYGECLKRTRWFLLPLVMVLWVNLHGGFLLGFLIVGVFCGVALLRRDWADFKIYSFAGVGCFIAYLSIRLAGTSKTGWRRRSATSCKPTSPNGSLISRTSKRRGAFQAFCIFQYSSRSSCAIREVPVR